MAQPKRFKFVFEVEFEGILLHDGKPVNLDLFFYPLLQNLREFDVDPNSIGAQFKNLVSDSEANVVRLLFTVDPRPNASVAILEDGRIRFNLGLAMLFLSVPSFISVLSAQLSEPSAPEILLREVRTNSDIGKEIQFLMQRLSRCKASKWTKSYISRLEYPHPFVYQNLCYAVLSHEMAHLFHERLLKKKTLLQTQGRAQQMVRDWCLDSEWGRTKEWEHVVELVRTGTAENWYREIAADQYASYALFDYLQNLVGNSSADKPHMSLIDKPSRALSGSEAAMHTYIAFEFLFSMLKFLELSSSMDGDISLSATHPPADFRRSIFQFIRAKELGFASRSEFYSKQYYAALMVGSGFEAALWEYVNPRGN